MQYRDIIGQAWDMTHTGRGLLWYGTVPAFFSTIIGIGYVMYQLVLFRTSPFFGGGDIHFGPALEQVVDTVMGDSGLLTAVVVTAIVMGAGFILVPPFCEGGLVGLIAAIHRGRDVHTRDGIAVGFARFFPIFEYRLAVGAFSFVEFFTILSMVLRNFGPSTPAFILFGVLGFIALIFHLLFIYSETFIVLEGKGVMDSFAASARLVLMNLQETLLMTTLMLLIFLRVILNVVLLFLIPALIMFVTGFFISKVAFAVGIAAGILVGLIALILAAYLAGTMHVFTTAAWTLTFLALPHDRVERILE